VRRGNQSSEGGRRFFSGTENFRFLTVRRHMPRWCHSIPRPSRGKTITLAKERPKSMEQPKDEELVCESCGVTFVYSAAAAAARAERGLTTKPTMCKPCWRARPSSKDSKPHDEGGHRMRRGGPGPRQPNPSNPWAQRGTGDVNEYRSPMPDPHFAGQAPRSGWSMKPSFTRRGPGSDGNYRAPSFQNEKRVGASRGPRDRAPAGRHPAGFDRDRPRVSTDITCAACGAASTVPFKPAEGQKVYCRACYQAEKPT